MAGPRRDRAPESRPGRLSPHRLTGSSVPDLIVSMSNQMWLHLQSDDSIASPGFKAVYQGRPGPRRGTPRRRCVSHGRPRGRRADARDGHSPFATRAGWLPGGSACRPPSLRPRAGGGGAPGVVPEREPCACHGGKPTWNGGGSEGVHPVKLSCVHSTWAVAAARGRDLTPDPAGQPTPWVGHAAAPRAQGVCGQAPGLPGSPRQRACSPQHAHGVLQRSSRVETL